MSRIAGVISTFERWLISLFIRAVRSGRKCMPPRTDWEDRGRPSMRGRGASHRDEAIEAGRHKGCAKIQGRAGCWRSTCQPDEQSPGQGRVCWALSCQHHRSGVGERGLEIGLVGGRASWAKRLRQNNVPLALAAKLSAQRRGERPERDRKAIAVALAKPRPRAGVRFVPTMVCSAISERTRRLTADCLPAPAAPLNLVIGRSLGPARPERPDLSVTQV